MLDQEEYERAKKKKAKKVSKKMQIRAKITCGECRFYIPETGMCDRDWPGVIGKLSARGAKTDHAKTYCGMAARGFLPIIRGLKEAEVESETPIERKKPGPKPKGGPGQGS